MREAYFHKFIERGRRFVWSLTVPADHLEWRYGLFGGDCFPTPNRLVVEETGQDSIVHFSPEDIQQPLAGIDYARIMFEPGDGTVTKASLLARQDTDPSVARRRYSYFSLKYPVFLCEQHTQLTGNISFQDNLMHFLLAKDDF